MLPLIAFDLLDAIALLAAASRNFADRCVKGLTANESRIAGMVDQSYALSTALVPEIGHERAAAIVGEAASGGKTIREVARIKKVLDDELLSKLLDPRSLADGAKDS